LVHTSPIGLELTKVNRRTLAVLHLRVRVCTVRLPLLVQSSCHYSGIVLRLFLSNAPAVRDDKFDEDLWEFTVIPGLGYEIPGELPAFAFHVSVYLCIVFCLLWNTIAMDANIQTPYITTPEFSSERP